MPKEVPGLWARHHGLTQEADSFLGARGAHSSSFGRMDGASPPVLGSGRALLGREREREALDRLLDGGRAGRGGVLVVHGEPGIGKTALLECAVETGREFRVASICGVESEMELAFAALQQLCCPYLELMEHLPEAQRDALAVAFGLGVGPTPNPFLVGLAVLGLLAEVAEEQPLLCVVDDAQWLDSASARALAFVSRRLLEEKITLLFATRELGEELGGVPDLEVRGLCDGDASALLSSVVPFLLDEQVRGRIVSETRGNPLALLELPRGLTPAQLAGGLGLVAAGALAGRIEESFARRLEGLRDDTRLLLLLAAADPVGDPLLLWRASEKLGIPAGAADEMEADGLLTLGEQVTFRHPLVRSAVYGSAPAQQRRAVHSALAEVTDRRADADRRAWHLAAAASAPDEDVASELERSAGRAQARGGLAAAAAFLQRSVALTGDPARRTDRALAAARANLYAGAFDEALRLVPIAEAGSPDELQRAHAELLRAQIAFASTRGSAAPTLLVNAARELESVDLDLARATYLEALSAAMFAGRLSRLGSGVHEVARATMAAPRPSGLLRAPDLLLDGLATLFTEGYRPAVPILRQAESGFDADMSAAEQLHWLWLASISAVLLWDDVRWETLSERNVQLARETGALGELTHALGMRAHVHFFAGELATAASVVDEIRATAEATGGKLPPYAPVGLAAMRGREAETVGLIDGCREELMRRREGIGISVLDWAEAVLYNGLGRYGEACAAAVRVAEQPDDVNSSSWGMVELIEAAVRAGTPELAAEAYGRLLDMTQASATDWGLGIAARSRALLAGDAGAESLYREAIERLGRTRLRPELARARLLYGEWLRRQRRHTDARGELRIAHEMFNDFGMEAFAERTRRELQATGEHPRRRTPDTRDQLTPQERQIARLAAEGRTNREIAAQLSISPNTVDYHLRKTFRKLDVKWRTQLVHRLR
jgi:DNA-binding CsgD family transcriptional regulator